MGVGVKLFVSRLINSKNTVRFMNCVAQNRQCCIDGNLWDENLVFKITLLLQSYFVFHLKCPTFENYFDDWQLLRYCISSTEPFCGFLYLGFIRREVHKKILAGYARTFFVNRFNTHTCMIIKSYYPLIQYRLRVKTCDFDCYKEEFRKVPGSLWMLYL